LLFVTSYHSTADYWNKATLMDKERTTPGLGRSLSLSLSLSLWLRFEVSTTAGNVQQMHV
jgi:hypothetical protein